MQPTKTKQQILETYLLANQLEQLPGGEYLMELRANLDPVDYFKELEFILDFLVNGLVLAASLPLQQEIMDLQSAGKYDEIGQVLAGLIILNPVFSQLIEVNIKLATEIIAEQYNIEL